MVSQNNLGYYRAYSQKEWAFLFSPCALPLMPQGKKGEGGVHFGGMGGSCKGSVAMRPDKEITDR